MLSYQIASTKDTSSEGILSVIKTIKQEKISFILFFASPCFDFHEVNEAFHEAFKGCKVLGGTSYGEIVEDLGYTEGHLVAISVYGDDFKIEAIALEQIEKKGMLYKDKVREALAKLHINTQTKGFEKQFFAISLIDAFSAAEERIMTMLELACGETPLQLVGGSCGSLDAGVCFMSLNGKVYQDAALLMFVKTGKRFMTYKENIYEPYGEAYRVTAADLGKRTVYSANGMDFGKLYANVVGVNERALNAQVFASCPIGRMIGNEPYIASIESVAPDGGIKFFTRVTPGSSFRFMKAVDPLEKGKETAAEIRRHLRKPKLIIGFNCCLRHIGFKEARLSKKAYEVIREVAPVFGFSTLGEQIGLTQVNQTLVLLAIED